MLAHLAICVASRDVEASPELGTTRPSEVDASKRLVRGSKLEVRAECGNCGHMERLRTAKTDSARNMRKKDAGTCSARQTRARCGPINFMGVLFAAPERQALREPTWIVQLSDTGDVVEQLSEGREQVPVMCHRARENLHEPSFGLCVATLTMRPAA